MSAPLITFVITTVVFVACICIVYAFVARIKRKAREISQRAFNTTDIVKGIQQMQDEFEESPKSVAAMTSVMLPRIVRDFPDFNYDEMKERAVNLLTSYLRAITDRSLSLISGAGSELKEKLETYINMLSDKGMHEHFDLIKLHRTEISSYRKADGKCIVTFQSSLECMHYITGSDGSVTHGSRDRKYQTRYNVDMIYVQDRNLVNNEHEEALGITCPNCGAPVKILGSKFCEYCGAGIVELNIHAWIFSNVEEVK